MESFYRLSDELLIIIMLYCEKKEIVPFFEELGNPKLAWETLKRCAGEEGILLPGEVFYSTRFCKYPEDRYNLLKERRENEQLVKEFKLSILPKDRKRLLSENMPYKKECSLRICLLWKIVRSKNQQILPLADLYPLDLLCYHVHDYDLLEELLSQKLLEPMDILSQFSNSEDVFPILFEEHLGSIKEPVGKRKFCQKLLRRLKSGKYLDLLFSFDPSLANTKDASILVEKFKDTEQDLYQLIKHGVEIPKKFVNYYDLFTMSDPTYLMAIHDISPQQLFEATDFRKLCQVENSDIYVFLIWLETKQLSELKELLKPFPEERIEERKKRQGFLQQVTDEIKSRFDRPSKIKDPPIVVLTMNHKTHIDDRGRKWVNMSGNWRDLINDRSDIVFIHDSHDHFIRLYECTDLNLDPMSVFPIVIGDRPEDDRKHFFIDTRNPDWQYYFPFNFRTRYKVQGSSKIDLFLIKDSAYIGYFLYSDDHPRIRFLRALREDNLERMIPLLDEIEVNITECGNLSEEKQIFQHKIGISHCDLGKNFLSYLLENGDRYPRLMLSKLVRKKCRSLDKIKDALLYQELVDKHTKSLNKMAKKIFLESLD